MSPRTRHQSQRMLAPALVLAGVVRTQMHDPISGGWQPVQPSTAPLTHQHVGIPLSRAYQAHERPISELGGQLWTQLFARALAVIEHQGNQHPAKAPEMTRLHTANNRLELVERMVDVHGDACERPHGLGSCVVLGCRHLPRYTGVIIFQALLGAYPSSTHHPPVTSEDIDNILTHNDTSILLASDLCELLHKMEEEKQLVETRYPTLYYLNTLAGKDALRRRIAAADDEDTREELQACLQQLEQEPSAHENDDDPCLPKDELIDAETTSCVTVHNSVDALE